MIPLSVDQISPTRNDFDRMKFGGECISELIRESEYPE